MDTASTADTVVSATETFDSSLVELITVDVDPAFIRDPLTTSEEAGSAGSTDSTSQEVTHHFLLDICRTFTLTLKFPFQNAIPLQFLSKTFSLLFWLIKDMSEEMMR